MSQAFRDALALHRLARIKQRSARMQVMAKAVAPSNRCDCAKCSLLRMLGAEPEAAETPPEASKAH